MELELEGLRLKTIKLATLSISPQCFFCLTTALHDSLVTHFVNVWPNFFVVIFLNKRVVLKHHNVNYHLIYVVTTIKTNNL